MSARPKQYRLAARYSQAQLPLALEPARLNPESGPLNAARARELLRAPMVFGDLKQIMARGYLADLARARARILACKVCRGSGSSRGGRLCRACCASLSAEVLTELGLGISARYDGARTDRK